MVAAPPLSSSTTPASTLAKISRPKMHRAIPRPRLFERLEHARHERSAICVVGPPGSGKTSLVASWLGTNRYTGLWYQVDPGDRDLATFFYYLGLACRTLAPKGTDPLPLLTAEYQSDVQGFARRFFRELFRHIPEDGCVVLDNYQEVPAEEVFHLVTTIAVQEVPPGRILIIISRRDPPDCYARLLANDNVGFLEWEDLRLTVDEAYAIAQRRGAMSREAFDTLFDASQGWAAGLTLMLEQLKRRPSAHWEHAVGPRETVFNYFATELFERFTLEEQHILLCGALLPRMQPSEVTKLCGHKHAGPLLDRLHRHRLFTDLRSIAISSGRQGMREVAYEFHPLFRHFLLVKGQSILKPENLSALRRTAARLLADASDFESALNLCGNSQDWRLAQELALAGAPRLLGQGRWRTVLGWLDGLAHTEATDTAEFHYWHGSALLNRDLGAARLALDIALRLYREQGNPGGELRCIAAIIKSHWIEDGVSREWVPWIEPMQSLLPAVKEWTSAADELSVRTAFLQATCYFRPAHPLIEENATRLLALIDDSQLEANARLGACVALITLLVPAGDHSRAHRVVQAMDPLLHGSDASALSRGLGICFRGYFKVIGLGQDREARKDLELARELAAREHLPGVAMAALEFEIYACLILGRDIANGARLLAASEQAGLRATSNRNGTRADNRMRLAEWHGDFAAAAAHAERALSAAEDHSPTFLLMLGSHSAHCFARSGEFERANALIQKVRDLIRGTCFASFEATLMLEEGLVAHHAGKVEASLVHIRRGLLRARSHHADEAVLHWLGNSLVNVCSIALHAGIEVNYVRHLIARWDLPATHGVPPTWPWPLSVHALGRFELRVRGEVMTFGRKVPRKALLLLKALIAYGASEVGEEKLIDAVWPEEDGDVAHARYKVTLARLRSLLGDADLIVQRDRKLSIDTNRCHIDTRTFELGVMPHNPSVAAVDEILRWLCLYEGDFLPHDWDHSWASAPRMRLRARYLEGACRAGTLLENQGRHGQALEIYAQASTHVPQADALIEAQARCLLVLGRAEESTAILKRHQKAARSVR